MEGMKFDGEKNRWHLVDFEFMDQCVRVLTFGAVKYDEDNWKKVEKKRYVSALFRHLTAYMRGEKIDSETGCSHLAHAFCNLMFLFGHDKIQLKVCKTGDPNARPRIDGRRHRKKWKSSRPIWMR